MANVCGRARNHSTIRGHGTEVAKTGFAVHLCQTVPRSTIAGRETRFRGTPARGLWLRCLAWWVVYAGFGPISHASAIAVAVPANCGSERELRQGLSSLGGQAAASADSIRLEITPQGDDEFELQLDIGDERRVLTDRDCRTLFRSAIVMLASALEAPAERVAAEPNAARAPEHSVHVSVAVGGGAVVGVVPKLGARVDVQTSLEHRWFGAQLGLHWVAPRSELATSRLGARVTDYGLRAAALFVPWPWLRAVLGIELNYLHASSLPAALDGSNALLTPSAVAETTLRVVRIGGAYLDVALWGQWALSRPQFEIEGFGSVYRLPRFAGGALARLGWTIF